MNRREFLSGSLSASLLTFVGCSAKPAGSVTVGSKNFTEQLVLGEILAQTIERQTYLPVVRRFYLAGTYICQQALLAGRIDTYVEYTGTALAAILKQKPPADHQQVFQLVKDEYARRFNLVVFPSLGFNNTFAMVMRSDQAQGLGVSKLSQLSRVSSQLRLGVGYEFLEREDGYNGLVKAYDLHFADAPHVMDLGLIYRALNNHQVDIVAGSNTDGQIAALGLTVLADDHHYFPPYDAVPIVRNQTLQEHPNLRAALLGLAGRFTADDMRRLNYAVDAEKQDAFEVVQDFLARPRIS